MIITLEDANAMMVRPAIQALQAAVMRPPLVPVLSPAPTAPLTLAISTRTSWTAGTLPVALAAIPTPSFARSAVAGATMPVVGTSTRAVIKIEPQWRGPVHRCGGIVSAWRIIGIAPGHIARLHHHRGCPIHVRIS